MTAGHLQTLAGTAKCNDGKSNLPGGLVSFCHDIHFVCSVGFVIQRRGCLGYKKKKMAYWACLTMTFSATFYWWKISEIWIWFTQIYSSCSNRSEAKKMTIAWCMTAPNHYLNHATPYHITPFTNILTLIKACISDDIPEKFKITNPF